MGRAVAANGKGRASRLSKADTRALAAEFRRRVDGEVRFSDGDRALYATDAGNYRHVPIGVVLPRSVEGIVETVAVAREFDAPVLPRGGGTSLAGQCCNVAVVIDCSKYLNRVLEVDAPNKRARVQPGAILDDLRAATRPFGLTFGPDPATHSRCTIGGMIGNDSCGVHSVLAEFYGPGPRTVDSIRELDVLTYDGTRMRLGADMPDAEEGRAREIRARLHALGERYAASIRERFPNLLRLVSGYNLPALLAENEFNLARALCGSEGTCVTILEATLTLIPALPERALLVLGYPSVYDAADHVPEMRELRPVGLEGMDDRLVDVLRKKGLHTDDVSLLPDGGGWLIVEFGAENRRDARDRAREAAAALRRRPNAPSIKILFDSDEQLRLWTLRESGLAATVFVPGEPDTWPGWEDSAVPVENLGTYLRQLRALMRRYGYNPSLYGHFGQGCVHCNVDFDLASLGGIATYRAFVHDAAELVTRLGGSLSGEHGDGQARGELLPIMFGEEIVQAFREFKAIWDPAGRMNPGKVVDAYPLDSNLRIPKKDERRIVATHFRYPDDGGSLEHATMRCVGVGECRRLSGGVMCPSFMALREEKHSTRGRAHLLFEMLRGESLHDGWKSEAVKESLDLCLSCKGCKSECPVNVDVATYRAEFLAHYYAGRLRPLSAYAFGLIDIWSALAAYAPRAANLMTQSPGLAALARMVAGVAPPRRIPRFARESFVRAFVAPRHGDRPAVLLWPDTFNNYFYPQTLRAAALVLDDAGWGVTLPAERLCCGRPLYDFGMLALAKRRLQRILESLAPWIDRGTPLVVLEPSCASVFRDELRSFFPGDERARRLGELTLTLGEFLAQPRVAYEPARLVRNALLHNHCHQTSVLSATGEREILRRMGLEVAVPEPGCCGMACAFGFERDKYDLSMTIAERALLPAVRKLPAESLVIADGFSCREQIAQGSGRHALHLAEVLAMALARRKNAEARAAGTLSGRLPAGSLTNGRQAKGVVRSFSAGGRDEGKDTVH